MEPGSIDPSSLTEQDLRDLIARLAASRLRETLAAVTDGVGRGPAGDGPADLRAERAPSARAFLAAAAPLFAGAAAARDFQVRAAAEADAEDEDDDDDDEPSYEGRSVRQPPGRRPRPSSPSSRASPRA